MSQGNTAHAQVIDRLRTQDVRRDARDMIEMLHGHDGSDRDRARNLRNRRDMIVRQHGDVTLTLAVYYGERIASQPRVLPVPTPEMRDRVRDELAHQGGYGGFRWHLATQLDQLPAPPHQRAVLAIVGIDARGRIDGSLPRPSHDALDKHFRRNLRALVQTVIEHPMFVETLKSAERKGERVVFLWRYERPHRVAA